MDRGIVGKRHFRTLLRAVRNLDPIKLEGLNAFELVMAPRLELGIYGTAFLRKGRKNKRLEVMISSVPGKKVVSCKRNREAFEEAIWQLMVWVATETEKLAKQEAGKPAYNPYERAARS